ncbi:MAG: 50S ribosomal protein L9 [Desulfovibrionaceae bacterium]|nr:50S ribosomal protein L9 [Desulfovibrionaceae bacterium]
MKLILRADVENLGILGDVVDVKPGYGRNFLLPQGLAMIATPANVKVFELERKKLEAKMEAVRAEAAGLAAQLEAASIIIPMHVGDNEKLYGSVTATMIGDALAAQGLDVDRRRILLDSSIRSLGEHPVRVRLHANVNAIVTVKVTAENVVYDDEPAKVEEAEAVVEAAAE